MAGSATSANGHFRPVRDIRAAPQQPLTIAEAAVAAFTDAATLAPDDPSTHAFRGLAFHQLGNFQGARTSCETKPDYWVSELCLAVVYDKLSRHADAEAVLAKFRASEGDSASVQYAEIYAQWGNLAKALEWLDTAVRVRDPGLSFLKADPLLDPLRNEPRFQAIERELKFPGPSAGSGH